ncbi:MAG TPA: ATP-binding cassette domain-containing protein [Bacteroidia bacterium]|nr:MAG: ABC transporter [Bacteroidetes bacterium OLB10]MBE7510100.1 ABC transporter ATP-binding protein [Bacteroidia bacterium]MBX3105304.1 ABC transporter ATP-binding protein [Bacteroidota bacterium]MCE7955682.1 ABC transporter ATP-binding protein [Bacteroidetes bacterium CHB6]OQB61267.1 MAG: putative ABC transporter ATP-binding protein [Bacteroidetes bacterium ADurb.Bin141]
MVTIDIDKIGKKFRNEWIFKNLSLQLKTGDVLGITGSNGSGKSTLLQVLSGFMSVSTGSISYSYNHKHVQPDSVYELVSLASPYLVLVEDYTLREMLKFYFRFKKIANGITVDNILEESLLKQHADKQLKDFSSGMKQKVKLLLAITSDTPILLLDEPCTNLDSHVIEWYQQYLRKFSSDRLIIVCSNQVKEELFMCNKFLSIEDFKK